MAFTGVPVAEALHSAVTAIAAAGCETPQLDAEVLLAHVLGTDRARLVLDARRPVEGPAVRAFQNAVRRRAVEREPVAYITGTKGFRHLELAVDPRVLIPRPDTETLVEAALGLPPGARVADVGTGCGAVALALKDERGDLDVVGTDSSAPALEVARANAARLGLDIAFAEGDLLAGAAPVDAVVSNPPYVRDGDALAPESARHEPAAALFGGPDGLAVIRRLVAAVAGGGARWCALEVGAGQAGEVAALWPEGWTTQTRRDLAGIERVVIAWR